MKCSAWGRPLQRHRRSDWERHTPWGPIEIKDDDYYLCCHCTGTGTSAHPLHWYLGTDRETWSLLRQEAAVDLATDESCQGAVDKLARHHPGVAMHRSTALRLLHHHGEQARAFVADKLKAALSDAAQEGQRRQTAVELEVEYDGGMIPVATLEPMPVEPGQEAETTPVRGAPKKRKTCRWEEVKVGLAQKPGEASRIYSVRPTGELDEAFRDLLAIACLQGWGEHTEVRGIADGAHYLRTRMEDTFRACPFRCILDRPHTKEHLSDVSKRLGICLAGFSEGSDPVSGVRRVTGRGQARTAVANEVKRRGAGRGRCRVDDRCGAHSSGLLACARRWPCGDRPRPCA